MLLLTPLLPIHEPLRVEMAFLVTGMVDPKFAGEFLCSTVYGDLLEAALALASILALRRDFMAFCRSSGVAKANIKECVGPVEPSARRLAVERAELRPQAALWYVYTFYAP